MQPSVQRRRRPTPKSFSDKSGPAEVLPRRSLDAAPRLAPVPSNDQPRGERPSRADAGRQRGPAASDERPAPASAPELGAFAELAFRKTRSGDLASALSLFESLTVLEPRTAYHWQGLGVAAERLGHLDIAERAFRRSAQLAPGQPPALLGLAEVSLARGQNDVARHYLAAALKHASGSEHDELRSSLQARLRLLSRNK